MQNRCCADGCFLNNSSNAHVHYLLTKMILHNFISLQTFTVYMENSLRFEISLQMDQMDRSEVCSEVSFTLPKLMWTLTWTSVNVTLHRREVLPRSEISNWFEFTSGLM